MIPLNKSNRNCRARCQLSISVVYTYGQSLKKLIFHLSEFSEMLLGSNLLLA